VNEQERPQEEGDATEAGTEVTGTSERSRVMTTGECERVRVLRELIASAHLPGHGKRQEAAAQKLGISVRSVRRLARQLREGGIGSVMRRTRSDRGEARISPAWQEFIVKTYREGNRGSRCLSPAQVAVRVKVRAQELGVETYPSHMSVYRILQPLIEKAAQSKRSIGWKGSRLAVKTREGLELAIEWSNQVWQCDHTKADVLVVDQSGAILGRPWLTTVVDTYSRCIMGFHLGMEAPSGWIDGLALRHAILPKQYSGAYELAQGWGTYGIPQYL